MTAVWKLESTIIIIIIVLLFLLGLGMGTRRLQVDFWQISFQKTEIFVTRPSASINLWQKHCFPQEVLATYENIMVAVKQ